MGHLLSLIYIVITLPQAHAEALISTQAQVRDHVITNREVAIHKLVDKVLGQRQDFKEMDNPLEALIREWLLFFEAQNFYNNRIPKKDIKEPLERLNKQLTQSGDKKKWDISGQELEEKVRRRLEADRIYLFKRKASILPVSLSDLEAEYLRNRHEYGDQSFQEVREHIRKRQDQESLEQRLQKWFEILENKYKVQRFFKYQVGA